MSFYENDPAEIRRHIDITTQLDQLHIDSKLQEHAQAKARRMAWAEHQRHMFRQQRLEVALRYQALGLQLRAPHQALFESPAEGEQEGEQVEGQEQGAEAAATEPAPVPAAIPLPKPTFVKVSTRFRPSNVRTVRQSQPLCQASMWRSHMKGHWLMLKHVVRSRHPTA